MERLYGGVCYAGIDVDQDLKYPKGAGRVAFNNQRSYIAAISARFVQLKDGEMNKRVSDHKNSKVQDAVMRVRVCVIWPVYAAAIPSIPLSIIFTVLACWNELA